MNVVAMDVIRNSGRMMGEITSSGVVPQLQKHVWVWRSRTSPVGDRGTHDADRQHHEQYPADKGAVHGCSFIPDPVR